MKISSLGSGKNVCMRILAKLYAEWIDPMNTLGITSWGRSSYCTYMSKLFHDEKIVELPEQYLSPTSVTVSLVDEETFLIDLEPALYSIFLIKKQTRIQANIYL